MGIRASRFSVSTLRWESSSTSDDSVYTTMLTLGKYLDNYLPSKFAEINQYFFNYVGYVSHIVFCLLVKRDVYKLPKAISLRHFCQEQSVRQIFLGFFNQYSSLSNSKYVEDMVALLSVLADTTQITASISHIIFLSITTVNLNFFCLLETSSISNQYITKQKNF